MYCTWVWAWVAPLASGSRNACESLTVLYIHQSMWRHRRFHEDVLAPKPGLFVSRISWQYTLPQKVHPRAVRQQRTVLKVMLYLRATSMRCSWTAVVSLSSHIWCSTISFISTVAFEGCPDPGHLVRQPVSSNFLKKRHFLLDLPWRSLPTTTSDSRSAMSLEVEVQNSLLEIARIYHRSWLESRY